jgi:hypothetical protein
MMVTTEVQSHENIEVSISDLGDRTSICDGMRELNRKNERIKNHNLYPDVSSRRRRDSASCDEGPSATGSDKQLDRRGK